MYTTVDHIVASSGLLPFEIDTFPWNVLYFIEI